MRNDVLGVDQANVRGADSNSLLRMYDAAREISTQSTSRQERARAERALGRIARELQKRNIRL